MKTEESNKRVLLHMSVRLVLMVTVLLALIVLGSMAINKDISWFIFVISYVSVCFAAWFAYKKISKQWDKKEADQSGAPQTTAPPKDDIEGDGGMNNMSPTLVGILVGFVSLIILLILSGIHSIKNGSQTDPILKWMKQFVNSISLVWGVILIIILIVVLLIIIFWPRKKRLTTDTTTETTTVRVVKTNPALNARNWGLAAFWWSLAGLVVLIVAIVLISTGHSLYLTFTNQELPQQTTTTYASVQPQNNVPFSFSGFGNKWETFEPGVQYRYIRGNGNVAPIQFHTADWRVKVELHRESDPSSVYIKFGFDQNYNLVTEKVMDDNVGAVPWYFTVDRTVRMLVN